MLKVREELERTFKAALLELSGTYKATAFEVRMCPETPAASTNCIAAASRVHLVLL
jgi:hypothetical protein